MSRGPLLFAPSTSTVLGERVAAALGIGLCPLEERRFEDGEHKARPLVSVHDADVYVLHALYGEPDASCDEKLVQLLFAIGALRDAGAARINAVVPYLAYARNDRRTQPRDPVATRYVATMLEAVGADRVAVIDVHNEAAYQNAFRVPAEVLQAKALFVRHFADRVKNPVVVTPDMGGAKRAERFRDALSRAMGREVPFALVEKFRSATGLQGGRLVGDVNDHDAIVVDDMIATGGTLARAARACHEGGATAVHVAATHGLFLAGAGDHLADAALTSVVVTDTVPAFRLPTGPARDKLVVLPIAPLLGEAIRRMHRGESLSDLSD